MVKEMNRSETRIYNLQLSILKLKKWDKVLAMKWGKEVVMPKPRRIELNGRLKRYDADVSDEVIRVSKDFYGYASAKSLRSLLKHELTHAFLMDNNIPYRHNSRTWNKVSLALGVRDNTNYEWEYLCNCGAWLKTHQKRNSWRCSHCGQSNVTKREYNKLRKIADINSKLYPVDIERFQVFKDVRRRA